METWEYARIMVDVPPLYRRVLVTIYRTGQAETRSIEGSGGALVTTGDQEIAGLLADGWEMMSVNLAIAGNTTAGAVYWFKRRAAP